jgi:small subunit ribosomal protein S8
MNTTDPIADMLTRIRNALRARHQKVEMPSSQIKVEIAKILKEEAYITGYKVAEEGKKKNLRITLKYTAKGEPAITKLDRISKPSRRVYTPYSSIPTILGGLGHCILTTPDGLMTGPRARKAKVGGEILLQVQ